MFEGLEPEQLRVKKRELGAEFFGSESSGLFLVPSERWDTVPNGLIRLWVKEREGRYHHFPAIPRPYPWTIGETRIRRTTSREDIPVDLTPLGGGKEIGANSFLLRVGGKHLLLDCGQDVAARSSNPFGLPRLEHIRPLCAIIVTHAHTDHVGALLTAHTLFPDVPIYCTRATLETMRVSILHHTRESFLRRREDQLGAPLPPSKVWDEEFNRAIRVVEFDTDTPIDRMPGVTFRFIPAGHILGAAGVGLTVGDRHILYTGDFCLTDQATVKGSSLPRSGSWDTVISESTNGAGERAVEQSIDAAVSSLHEILEETVRDQGVALLPAFSLGKAQEVYALLTKTLAMHWPSIPLDRVQVEGLARDFFPIYSVLNPSSGLPLEPARLGDVDAVTAPAIVKQVLGRGPDFIIATHGMMAEGTISHSLGVHLLGERRATIITTGYQAPGTLGGELQQLGRHAGSLDGRVHHDSLPQGVATPVCAIKELRISGHAPLADLLDTIRRLSPQRVVLVHGSIEAITRVKNDLERILPDVAIATPTNLETVELGYAHLPPRAFEDWEKTIASLPVVHPDLIKAAEDRKRPSHAHREIPGLRISLPDEDRRLKSRVIEGRLHIEVPLSPQLLKATIRVGPGVGFSLSDYDSVVVTQLPAGTHKPLIDLNREGLAGLPERFLERSLLPGDYRVVYRAKSQTKEILVRVTLNLEDEEDWVLERGGSLSVDVPMLEGHTRMFQRIEVVNRERNPDRGVIYNVIPMGNRLRMQFQDVEDRSRECSVLIRFKGDYSTSVFRLIVGAPGPNAEELSLEPSEIVIGGRAMLKVSRPDVTVTVAEDSSDIVSWVYVSDTELAFDPRDIGDRMVGIAVRKSDGRIRRTDVTIVTRSALAEGVKERQRVLPSQTTNLELPLKDPEAWVLPTLDAGGLGCSIGSTPRGLSLSVGATGELGLFPVKIKARRRRDGVECTIAHLEIEVAERESMDYARSRLVVTGEGVAVFHSDGSISEERVAAILASLGPYAGDHQLSGRRKELTVRLRPADVEDKSLWIDLPRARIRLFNPAAFTVEFSQGGVGGIQRCVASEPIRICVNDPLLGPFEEMGEGGIAVVRKSPLVEWIPVDLVSPGVFEITPGAPGSYSLLLIHHRQPVVQRDFEVADEGFQLPGDAPHPQEISEEIAVEDLNQRISRFVSDIQRAPMLIALGPKGTTRLIDSKNLKKILLSHVERLPNNDVLIIIVPGNDVPAVVSGVLFSAGVDWVALAYPSPRDSKLVTIDKAIKQFTSQLGAERRRVEWHRFIPLGESNEWTPSIIVLCPSCHNRLVVVTEENPPRTKCRVCGFSTTHALYSMNDLDRHTNRVFVIQLSMLTYLHRQSEEWFGKRLLRTLHCRRCDFVSDFRNRNEIEGYDERFGRVREGQLTGDLELLIEGGWWCRDGTAYAMADITQKLRHGHCPNCCRWHDNNQLCRETPLDDGVSNVQIMLAGLDRFTVSTSDPYESQGERFPDYHYPGVGGDQDPRTKLETMVKAAEEWWRMD